MLPLIGSKVGLVLAALPSSEHAMREQIGGLCKLGGVMGQRCKGPSPLSGLAKGNVLGEVAVK